MIIPLFKWLWLLLKAMVLRKSNLVVSFTREENDRWFVDFPNWPLSYDNLEMVAGADDLLDILNDGSEHVKLIVSTKEMERCIVLNKEKSALTKGAFYTIETRLRDWNPKKKLWLCPVTLTVLGCYPQKLYFKRKA